MSALTVIVGFLDFWPLNTSWYTPAMVSAAVALALFHLVPGLVRRHVERASSAEFRELHSDGR